MRRVLLGKTGIEVSQLCIGTGTRGWSGESDQTRKLGIKGLADLLVYAFERGITFIDSADDYGSHPHVREASKRIGRENLIITTKTCAKDAQTMRRELDRFRCELGTDYLDVVLLHCLMDQGWPVKLRPVMDVLSEAREDGIVRAVGCSNHDFGALCTAADEPWVEVVLVRINPTGHNMEAAPEDIVPIIERMKGLGIGTYGMKVLAQGRMSDDPKSAIRYQLDVPVDAFVIGMESREQVDENVRLLEQLTEVSV